MLRGLKAGRSACVLCRGARVRTVTLMGVLGVSEDI